MRRRSRVQIPPELTTLIVDEILRQTEDNYFDRRQRLATLSVVCQSFYYATRRAMHSRITFPVYKNSPLESRERRAQKLLWFLQSNQQSLAPIREFSFLYDIRPHTHTNNDGRDWAVKRSEVYKPPANYYGQVGHPWQANALAALAAVALSSPQVHTFTFGSHRRVYRYRDIEDYANYIVPSAIITNTSLRVLKFRNIRGFPRMWALGPYGSSNVEELVFENAVPDCSPSKNSSSEIPLAIHAFSRIKTLTLRAVHYQAFNSFMKSCLPKDFKYLFIKSPALFFTGLKTLTVSLPTATERLVTTQKENGDFGTFMDGILQAKTVENLTIEDFGERVQPRRYPPMEDSRHANIWGIPIKHLTLTSSDVATRLNDKVFKMQQTIDSASYYEFFHSYLNPLIETVTFNVWVEHFIPPGDMVPHPQQLLFNSGIKGWLALDQALLNKRLLNLRNINLNLKAYYYKESSSRSPKTRIENLTSTARRNVASYLMPHISRHPGFSITFEAIYTNMALDTYLGHP